ncbi:hypothetical protein RIF29_13406 [Crotalaria pallida]|uniref:TPX2 central domain-containing protein n=1 Tax=Crotalaria pallida TaxID=3830 RepID=A0AAN9P210_CROPI
MEEEFEEIEVEASLFCDEIDLNYEFDAPRFCDFTTSESFWDAYEAEQWFEFASSYPSSPFLLKFDLGNCGAMENGDDIADDDCEDNNDKGHEFCNQSVEEISNGKMKSLSKLRGSISKISRFMMPTASHLAKQKNPTEVQTPPPRRFQSQNSSIDGELSKRQKLEAGYLSKVARLKHQTLFTHKKHKEVYLADNNLTSKSKVTIPREPNLETASRAQRRKSKTKAESGGDMKSSSQMFKARPLNKKEFHFRTSERATQHASSNAKGNMNRNSIPTSETRELRRTNSSDRSKQDTYKMINKHRGSPDDKQLSSKGERGVFRNIKVFPLEPNEKRSLDEPPTNLFNKLSLTSEVKQTTKCQSKKHPVSKNLKENRPGSLSPEHEKMNRIKEGLQRPCRKQYQCMNGMESLVSNHACMLELGH